MKDLRKTCNIADVVHKKRTSNEQIKKLFDGGELELGDKSYRQGQPMEVFRKMSFPQWKFSWPGNFLLLQTSARNYSLYQAKLLGGNGYEARQISKD